jgi:hypothetical protein
LDSTGNFEMNLQPYFYEAWKFSKNAGKQRNLLRSMASGVKDIPWK